MSVFEANKIIAAVLTVGVVALASGFISTLVFEEHKQEEKAYPIVAETGGKPADAPAEAPQAAAQVPLAALLAKADPAAGEKVTSKCKSCHTFDEGGANRIGPNLYGVVGRQIASHEGFSYSDALKAKAGESWSYDGLDAFLTAPKDWAPGTKMSFAGIKSAEDRAALLAYLRQLSANPLPLPQ